MGDILRQCWELVWGIVVTVVCLGLGLLTIIWYGALLIAGFLAPFAFLAWLFS